MHRPLSDGALLLDELYHVRHRILRRYPDQHVHRVGYQGAFFDVTLLRLQLAKRLPEMVYQILIERLSAALRNMDNMVFALPTSYP